jgi:hypothetical protein
MGNSVLALLILTGCSVSPFQQNSEDQRIAQDVWVALAVDKTAGVNSGDRDELGGFVILTGRATLQEDSVLALYRAVRNGYLQRWQRDIEQGREEIRKSFESRPSPRYRRRACRNDREAPSSGEAPRASQGCS